MRNPNLETAIATSKDVLDETMGTDQDVSLVVNLIVALYDLDYTGLADHVKAAVTGEADIKKAVKVINATKDMYTSGGN